ncbi:hypothetical protein A0U93_05720 [Neoasaia chiangmaiensis]|uniref:Uncharacterized protein n=1 Tax=Neoasaia chiangmaiensis TaxID=320497 RepID=A0A1U9KNZ7_9PROT|nr:hypothetical protein A0U93_05720 [Neoasaia chiangmaiensis]
MALPTLTRVGMDRIRSDARKAMPWMAFDDTFVRRDRDRNGRQGRSSVLLTLRGYVPSRDA